VVLTGAGISVESGLRSFPGAGGLWQGWRLEDVATPEGFARDPVLVQRFYDARRRQLLDPAIQPNAAQLALAEVERRWPDPVLLVTQSIDDLHERAGTRSLIPMHGELLKARCLRCGAARAWSADLGVEHRCAACDARNALRPHVVWFGELPLDVDAICQALAGCTAVRRDRRRGPDLPSRGFALAVRAAGRAHTVELNLEPSACSSRFEEHRQGPATELVPRFVAELLARAAP
jgi:NAD-dependent deacetylase